MLLKKRDDRTQGAGAANVPGQWVLTLLAANAHPGRIREGPEQTLCWKRLDKEAQRFCSWGHHSKGNTHNKSWNSPV